jgi:hypothetical protein
MGFRPKQKHKGLQYGASYVSTRFRNIFCEKHHFYKKNNCRKNNKLSQGKLTHNGASLLYVGVEHKMFENQSCVKYERL